MRVSFNGLELLKESEGFSAKPYLCPAGVPTVGYGSTFYPDGTKVTLKDRAISRSEATELLRSIVVKDFNINSLLKVAVTQNQFDAMTSLAYNIGIPAFSKSTLLKKVNAKDFKGAAEEFLKWNRSSGVVLEGLSKRRAKEKELFLRED